MDWEGLVRGAAEACCRVGLPDVREEVKKAAMYFSLAQVKKEMNSDKYKKLDKIKNINCRYMQSYMDKSLEDSRLEFRWLTIMLDDHAGPVSRHEDLSSVPRGSGGGQEKSPSLLLSCQAYIVLRAGKDPELSQKDRSVYLRAVTKLRSDLESK